MTAPDRVACCITGCRRTFKREAPAGVEELVICRQHGRMAPKAWWRRYRLFRRIADNPADARRDRAAELEDAMWERIRARIEDVVAGRITDPALAEFLETL